MYDLKHENTSTDRVSVKITRICEAIAKKVILPQIWPIFRPSLAQIVSKIAKFVRISKFSDLNHGNTSTDWVSTQNDPNIWIY